jgi:UPF0755 protein
MIRKLLVAGLTLVVVGAAGMGYVAVHRPTPGAKLEVEIQPGRSTLAIARQLQAQGVIGSVAGFRIASRLRGLDGDLRAGRYELREGMGVQAALDALSRGPVERFVRVTIPEGYTIRQIAQRVAQRTHIGAQAFLDATARVRSALQPPNETSLEGFAFPETYVVGDKEAAGSLVARMVQTFEKASEPLDWSTVQAKGLTRYQAVIAASLVEREAKVPEDRAKVAAVIYNRLAKGMRLEIDATVLYDLPQHKVPTQQDLKRPSPYNTYLHAGLPPTPIANPGLEAIKATLDPAPIDALYYVVIDPSGRHGFTASYEEFQRMLKLRPKETTGRR